MPFSVPYLQWANLHSKDILERIRDPYLDLPPKPTDLPTAAKARLVQVIALTNAYVQRTDFLSSPQALSRAIQEAARTLPSLDPRTVKRWTLKWLQGGSNPLAVVKKLIPAHGEQAKTQTRGAKRGAKRASPDTASDAAAHEVAANIEMAVDRFVLRGMTRIDAYNAMLLQIYKVPPEAITGEGPGLFLDRAILERYRPPTWDQFQYRVRLILRLKKDGSDDELPKGKRGKANQNVPGPGFFEIDATHFQIQLVSRLTKARLVGRPTVYLIVDVFDGAIVGYAVTLENPSWAVAALALFNCFSDKSATFARLGMSFTSEDWACHELPCVLTADRAELVSNMGQEFPASGIRVCITEAMEPRAKGTVEGKHGELKKRPSSRFDLPGRFEKMRRRRMGDGKDGAALDLELFEQIIVEVILDINNEPVNPRLIPPDALPLGAKVASRIGLHVWGLEHRSGFTRSMAPNFAYEHLLKKSRATVTSLGLEANGEQFTCDRLRDIGWLLRAATKKFKIDVAYNPLYAGEIFYFDPLSNAWVTAFNTDPEIIRAKASFAEAKEYRRFKVSLVRQTSLNNHSRRMARLPGIKSKIRAAVAERTATPSAGGKSVQAIRENRRTERATNRLPGFNGNLPSSEPQPSAQSAADAATTQSPQKDNRIETARKSASLWQRVTAVGK